MRKVFCLDCQKLFTLTERTGQTLVIERELHLFLDLIRHNFSLKDALYSPRLRVEQKVAIAKEIIASYSIASQEIIKLYIEHHQLSCLAQFAQSFSALIESKKNLLLGEFISARSASPAEIEKAQIILSRQTGRPVVLKNSVDPSLLGGFKIKLSNHKIMDASLKQKLANLKNRMCKEMLT